MTSAEAPFDSAMEQFSMAMRRHGRSQAEVEAALALVDCGRKAGLIPRFRNQRQALVLTWPRSERGVGGIVGVSATDAQATFWLRWVLLEPAFRDADPGNELIARLESLKVPWVRLPRERGFPNVPLEAFLDEAVRWSLCDGLNWVVGRLNDYELPPDIDRPALAEGGHREQQTTDSRAVAAAADEGLQSFIKRFGLAHTRDVDGGFELSRSYEAWLGRGVFLQFALRGQDRTVLQFLTTPDRTTPAQRWHDVLDACNEWNLSRHWPKAYFLEDVPEMHGNRVGQIAAEAAVDLGRGGDSAAVADWAADMVGAAFDFWHWLTTVKGL